MRLRKKGLYHSREHVPGRPPRRPETLLREGPGPVRPRLRPPGTPGEVTDKNTYISCKGSHRELVPLKRGSPKNNGVTPRTGTVDHPSSVPKVICRMSRILRGGVS